MYLIKWIKIAYYTLRRKYSKPFSDEEINYKLKIYMLKYPYVPKPITQDEYETFDPSKMFKMSTPASRAEKLSQYIEGALRKLDNE